jgi:hypothetical protein
MFGCAKPPDMLAISPTTTDFLQHNQGTVSFRRRRFKSVRIGSAQSACEDQLSGACRQSSTLDGRLART